MPYVDANKKLANPLKTGRLLYVLEPLLPEQISLTRGNFKTGTLESLLRHAKVKAKDPHVTAPLQSYQLYHRVLKKRLPELEDKKIIFTTGVSPDLSQERPANFGVDFFYEGCLLSTKILKAVNELDSEYQKEFSCSSRMEDLVFFPVAPIALPLAVKRKDKEIILAHPFPDVYSRVNATLPANKRVSPTLEKRLNQASQPRKGNSEFWISLFEPDQAKRYLRPVLAKLPLDEQKKMEKRIEQSTYLNKQLMALAYKTIFDLFSLERINIYAKKTSYVFDIFKYLPEQYKISDFGGVMRSTNLSYSGEADDSAIRVLKGHVWSWLTKENA